ncbi:hypothetical protein ILUMI_18211 [Ignelater luminosus]|uniref:Uncharacterized protein n=1 Tax=Ignelater luminosus TaxID=2038154 RepID=A0A8K0CPK3_IGNLU|nr:hypothetical protein ILUMI_18211 [Ignelater luminosus]
MPKTYICKANAKPRVLWTSNDLQSAINVVKSGIIGVNEAAKNSSQPGPSGVQIAQNRTPEKSSPGKAPDLFSPVPVITLAAKRARRPIAGVLSSNQCITKQPKTKRQNNKRRQPSKKQKKASSSSESEEVVLDNSEEEQLSDYGNECVGCREDFRKTKKKDDWIQCILLKQWLHEGCTNYGSFCHLCGARITKRKK